MKKLSTDDSEDDGTRHFMVNVIEPQFNLHSEDANVSCKGYFSFRIILFYFFSHEIFQSKKIIVYFGFSGPLFLLLLGQCSNKFDFTFYLFIYL